MGTYTGNLYMECLNWTYEFYIAYSSVWLHTHSKLVLAPLNYAGGYLKTYQVSKRNLLCLGL